MDGVQQRDTEASQIVLPWPDDGQEVEVRIIDAAGAVVVPTTPSRWRRAVGWLAIGLGVAGVLLGAALVWLGLGVVDRMALTVEDGLGIADDSLAAMVDTIDVAEATVAATAHSLGEVEEALSVSAVSLDRVDDLIGETSDILAGDVAGSIDSLLVSLPRLIEAGDSIDQTLRTLAIFGVPTDHEQSVGDGFREMEAALSDVPERLRDQSELLITMRRDLVVTGRSLERIRTGVGQIRQEMARTSGLLGRYRATAADGTDLIADVRSQVERAAPIARIGLVVVGVFLMLYQVFPIHLGWRAAHGDGL